MYNDKKLPVYFIHREYKIHEDWTQVGAFRYNSDVDKDTQVIPGQLGVRNLLEFLDLFHY